MSSSSHTPPDWKQGKHALAEVFDLSCDPGYLDVLDKGSTYAAFVVEEFEVDGEPTDVVVRVPQADVDEDQPECARREHAVLEQLWERREALPFEIPRPLGLAEVACGVAMVQTRVYGAELDQDVIQSALGVPCEVCATGASGLHELEPSPFREHLDGPDTRRDHVVETVLPTLERDEAEEFERAREWVTEHLPPDRPARLLHGNLLGHSLLVQFDHLAPADTWRLSIVDWEDVRLGDPAHDLAIVSRGRRHVYKETEDKLEDLVEAYQRERSLAVEMAHVRLWELHLKALWYLQVLEARGEVDAHVQHKFNAFCNQLERCERL